MKQKYKKLKLMIVTDIILIVVMSNLEFEITSLIGGIIAIIVLMGPTIALLYLLSNDNEISDNKRILAKIGYLFICLAIISGIIVKIMGLEN